MEKNEKKGESNKVATTTKKKQEISRSYLMKSFGQNIAKLKATNLITGVDAIELERVYDVAMRRFIQESMNINEQK